MVFLISYDLNKPGQNYDEVHQAIMDASDGRWCHCLESTWLIRSKTLGAEEISERIMSKMDKTDRLLVIEVKPNYQGWLSRDLWDYIKNELFS